jgi:hypothetical protein
MEKSKRMIKMNIKLKNIAAVLSAAFLFSACLSDNGNFAEVPESHGVEVEIKDTEIKEIGFQAGTYENAMLAIDSNNISGFYQIGSFAVFIEGAYVAGKAAFPISWSRPNSEEKGNGTLMVTLNGIRLKLEGNPGNCPADMLKGEGLIIPLNRPTAWKQIKKMENAAEIFTEPEAGMEMGSSFKKGDIICILEKKNKWIRVEKIGKSTLAGWIRE